MCFAGEQRGQSQEKGGENRVTLDGHRSLPPTTTLLRFANTGSPPRTARDLVETRNLRFATSPLLPMSLPLPSTTTNDTVNDSQAGSRKRQRSHSMQSDSSSPKRSASEDPTQDVHKDLSDKSARPSPIPSEPTPVLEDSPMADGPTPSQDVPMPSSSLPPVDPTTIDSLIIRPLQIGETWYIVYKKWIDRWRKAFSGQEDKEEGIITEATLGPPDKENHNLLDEKRNLRKDVTGETVDFVPEEVWGRFVAQ
jgi:ubiquitin carboxyl-terminal hydrolase 4/11/15